VTETKGSVTVTETNPLTSEDFASTTTTVTDTETVTVTTGDTTP
jgi:hypothetical protein